MTSIPLPLGRMVAILPERYRLARRRRILVENLAHEDFVSLTPGASSRAEIGQVFAARGCICRQRIEKLLSEIACAIVAAVAIVDPLTATEYEGTGLVARPFERPVTFAVSAVYTTHRGLSEVAQELLEEFSALLGEPR